MVSQQDRRRPSAPAAPARPSFSADFPRVVVQRGAESAVRLTDLPDYDAAKHDGDFVAARDVVGEMLNPSKVDELRQVIGDRQPVLVAVHQEEDGRNAIPAAYAAVLGDELKLPVDDGIVQTNALSRTGADSDYRLAHRSSFDGQVQPGQDYVIVDDAVTQGGTLADLRGYIESQGGRVIAATTLIQSAGSHILAPRPDTLAALRAKFPELQPEMQRVFGHGLDRLTESEARAYLRYPSFDAIRNRVLARAQEIRGGGRAGAFGAGEGGS